MMKREISWKFSSVVRIATCLNEEAIKVSIKIKKGNTMSPLSDFKLGTTSPRCVSRRLCAFSTLGRFEGAQKRQAWAQTDR